MACARCGCGVHQTEDIVTLNKIWHKCCFTCYRCRKKLNKCTAKIFQGEVFCDCCYKCLLEELELLSSSSKPCRVVSSPSCTCIKNDYCKPVKVLPPFDSSKKCEVCFRAKQKVKCAKSCSFIPDKRGNKNNLYCLSFPVPREVANYCSRVQTMHKQKQNPPPCCCRPKKPDNNAVCIKIRPVAQQRPCAICRQVCCRQPLQPRPPPPATCPPPGCCCPPPKPPPPPPRCRTPSPRCRTPPPRCRTPPPRCRTSPPRCRTPSPPQSYPPPPPCPQSEKCCCPQCCPPPRCRPACCPPRPAWPKRDRSQPRRKPCAPCCPDVVRKQEFCKKQPCVCTMPKYCPCGNLNPCNCKMCQVRALCTPDCNRCGQTVYAAEKISVTSGAYHTSCFSCYCCHKLLDVKNVYENCREIYCKRCYNTLFGNQFYGFGSSQLC